MKTHIAWISTLAAGAALFAPSAALAQQAKPKAAPATKPAPAGLPPATPADQPRKGVQVAPNQADQRDPKVQKAGQQAALALKQEMEQILGTWEKRSSQVKTLNVNFDRIDQSVAWGQEEYTGQAILQSPDLAVLHFKKRTNPGAAAGVAPAFQDDERIVCNASEVLQYKWDEKKLYIYPLDPKIQQKTLQQGPLPFLFNMKAAETRKRYDMALIEQSDKEYMIRIAPIEEIDRESFSTAYLKLDKKSFLPNYLRLIATNGKDYQDFKFANVVANQAIDPKTFRKFQLPGWKEIVNDGKEMQASAPAAGRAAPGRGAIQPPRPGQANRGGAAVPR